MKYYILLLTLLSFSTLHAQNGWKDMGGYKETTDTTGEVLQIKPTTDGKYLYVLCTLMDSTVKRLALQKWDVDRGHVVLTSFVDTKEFSAVKVNLNCDAATYSIYGVTANPTKYRIVVRDNDTGIELLRAIDNEDMSRRTVVQLDYDSGNNYFFIAYNSDYYYSNGPEFTTFSNGFLARKKLVDSVLSAGKIMSPNTSKFIHSFNSTIVAAHSYFHFTEVKGKNPFPNSYTDNLINYVGTVGNGINLTAFTSNNTSAYTITLSPNGSMVSATDNDTKSTILWYIDSTMRSNILGLYRKGSNSQVFSRDNKYLIVNSPADSTITTINASMRTLCGSITHPVVKKITEIFSLPQSTTILAACTDRKFRLITTFSDTTTPAYAITVNKTSIYQHNSVAFCAAIPSFDSSSILWDFGDGSSSTSVSPLHKYDSVGVFDVTMRVTDNYGQHEVTQKKLIEVKPAPNPITLDFDADVRYGSAPLKVKFTNKSTGTILSYKWSYDDGTTSAAKDTVHTFNQQRSYTITLTVNNGIKDTSLTKYHFINADEYPAFLLKTKLVNSKLGYQSESYRTTKISTYSYETMIRSAKGNVYLKELLTQHDFGTYSGGAPLNLCGSSTQIYSLQNTGIDKTIISSAMSQMDVIVNNCTEGTGLLGILSNDLLSYFSHGYQASYDNKYYRTDIVGFQGDNLKITSVQFPFYTMYYRIHSLHNTIDCYAFRKDRGLSTDSTFLCFYTDTTKLLAKDNLKGYALPAIETSGGRFMTVVSPISIDSTINRRLQLRWYDGAGTFLDSLVITRPTSDFIYDIAPLPNNRFMLSGNTTFYLKDSQGNTTRTAQGLIMIIDDKGTVEFTKQLPQWQTFKRIMPMDERTFALTGTPTVAYPGFIAVKSDGKIVGDFRADVNRSYSNAYDGYNVTACMNCVDVNFGKTIRTVFFTRNDGYNAELYVSDNPYLQDISVSVDESPVTGRTSENQLTVSPNPTDGNSTLHYYSTTPQRITLTVTSLLGEVYRTQVLDVESGENLIPLDLSGFGSGVAFLTVAGARDVQHAQVCVVR